MFKFLTETKIDDFRLATAVVNCNGYEEDATLEQALCSPDEVVETRQTLADFIRDRGKPTSSEKYSFATIYIWENQQSCKGKRRGDLYVVDFGDLRAAYFSGES